MPFRPEKIVNADVAAKKRKYSPSEAKQQAHKNLFQNKSESRFGVHLLLSTEGEAGMSNVEVTCFMLDR